MKPSFNMSWAVVPACGRAAGAAYRRVLTVLLMVCALSPLAWAQANREMAVYLYASPITTQFYKQNGALYDTFKDRWKTYFRQTGTPFQEVTRDQLLAGLPRGALVLASAVLLDAKERAAIEKYADQGNALLATWATGARDGKGHWTGYGFLEKLFGLKVTGTVKLEDNERFFNTFGDGTLTWGVPGGYRFFLGEVAETPLRIQADNLSARLFNWVRYPGAKDTNGGMSFIEKGASRRVFIGFPESSWEFDSGAKLPKLLDGVMAWLRRQVIVTKAAWPNGRYSAQLLEMDTEDQYPNALNFARELDKAGIRGTFYSLTTVALKYRDIVDQLSKKHEIGYHGEVHFGYKGKPVDVQEERIRAMVGDMKNIVGSQALAGVTGFRAPTESWDVNTELLLHKVGVRHHVADPASTEARMPFFSLSDPKWTSENAIVVLPRTQMDDLNYLGLKVDNARASALIRMDFDYLHEAGVLGVLSVHSQNYGPKGLMTFLTPPYVQRLQEHRKDVWAASGGEIATWWRNRERVRLQPGPLLGDEFHFTVQGPGDVKGLTLLITHPAQNKAPTDVSASRANAPTPRIQKVDAWRSFLVFEMAVPPGDYTYSVRF